MIYILFALGFVLLIKGADLLVGGASALAGRMGVSALVIGLTLVAFGTSAPELIVNILASQSGNTDLAIGNILGSNIVNILLILGVSAIVCPLVVHRGTVWKEIPFALLAAIVVAFMANDVVFDGATNSALTRIDGLVLISFFVIFLYYIFELARSSKNTESVEENFKQQSYLRSWVMMVLGILGLVVGGKWIIDGAVYFATNMGISQTLVGLTVVAIGTSLPEFATSVVAAYKRNVDIAIGNIVGSNIFNIFWILGLSSIINPLPFAQALSTDMMVVIIATLLLFLSLFIGQKHTLDRWQGVLFVLIYVAYMVYIIGRG